MGDDRAIKREHVFYPVGAEVVNESQHPDSNRGPTDYKSVALPLCYAGVSSLSMGLGGRMGLKRGDRSAHGGAQSFFRNFFSEKSIAGRPVRGQYSPRHPLPQTVKIQP